MGIAAAPPLEQSRERSERPVIYPMLRPLSFKEDRATQAAAHLLQRRGGQMSYMKLIKLMYFADREALLKTGRPITYDQWVCMQHGPVLSRTYDLIAAEPDPKESSYWHKFISGVVGDYEVKLLHPNPPTDQLSRAQTEILDRVFNKWGGLSRWEVRDASHLLPEFTTTKSSVRIPYRDVLIFEGASEAEAAEVEADLEAEEHLSQLAG